VLFADGKPASPFLKMLNDICRESGSRRRAPNPG
jgi:hypothetical protein